MQLPPDLALQGLYDGQGIHLGGIYRPLMENGQLTEAHVEQWFGRPAVRLIWCAGACSDPDSALGLVYMMPDEPNPLTLAPDILGYLVQVLDAGQSIKLHAFTEGAIDALFAAALPMVGGWHA